MSWLSRVANVFRSSSVERALDEEIAFHIQSRVDELVAAGIKRDEAEGVARRQFGNRLHLRESSRDVKLMPWLDDLARDLRHGVRSLRRNPAFAGVAILILALGIGANTAIFSVVHSLILQPLPFPDSDRLVRIVEKTKAVEGPAGVPQPQGGLNAIELEALRSHNHVFTHIGTYRDATVTLTGSAETARLQGVRLSPAVFASLGVPPSSGRLFDEREDDAPLVVIAHATWRRYFAGDPSIVGRSVRLDGNPYVVIGVMPSTFQFPDGMAQFWMPSALPTGRLALLQRTVPLARVRPGVPIETVRAEVEAIVQRVRRDSPPSGNSFTGHFTVIPMQEAVVAAVRPALLTLTVAVGFVLLIACVNVANLLLARGATREQEVAVRLALGAGRWRLIRQLLTESVVLALAGGITGTVLAIGSIRLLKTLGASLPRQDLVASPSLPRVAEITVDSRVLVFTLAISLFTALVFGSIPAIYQWRHHRFQAFRERLGRSRTQRVLVVAEIGLAMVLLVGGGLLIHSFFKLSNVDPGYDARNVMTFALVAPPGRYGGPQMASLAETLVARLEAAPGVRAAGYTELLPMVRFRTSGRITTASERPDQSLPATLDSVGDPGQPDTFTVSRRFPDAMGMRLIAGRGFEEDDRAGRPGVVLINRALARSGFLGPNPLGQRISTLKQTWEVVGIVENVQQFGLDQDPVPQVFFEMRQTPAPGITARVNYFVVRTDSQLSPVVSTVRSTVRQLDPQMSVDLVAPMQQLVSNSISRPRLYAVLLGVFAAVAVILAAVGLYGVMAYSVTQRTREIGVRMALGAQRGDVMSQVVREGLALTVIGLAIGLIAAAMTMRYVENLLFGLTALDPVTFLAASLLFAGVATFASYVPARRATSVDPLVALRYE